MLTLPNHAKPSPIAGACILAWIGLLICLLLVQAHAGAEFFFCSRTFDCAVVLSSRYSVLLGVPLPWWGCAFYGATLVALLYALAAGPSPRRATILQSLLWLAVAGLTFSGLLIFVQAAVIHAFCLLCLSSALVLAGLIWTLIKATQPESSEIPGSPGSARLLAIFATPATIVLLISTATLLAEKSSPSGPSAVIPIDLSAPETIGPRNARVQLVVFSDYTCKFCIELAAVLKKVREKYPQDVLIAHRAFPLDHKGLGYSAALAAQSAAEQGKFWEYHDRVFAESPLTEAKLLTIAEQSGLDLARFEESQKSAASRQKLEASIAEIERTGLKGVPAVFLNGSMIVGVVDYPTLERRIQAALHPADK